MCERTIFSGRTYFVLIVSLFLVSTACQSKPSDTQAREVLAEKYKFLTDLGAKVVDFQKLNGEVKTLGETTYVYTFLCAVELPSGIAWERHPLLPSGGGFVKDPGVKRIGPFNTYTPLPKGTVGVRKGTINFRSTERGWIAGDVDWVEGYCTDLKAQDCYKKLGLNKIN